MATVVINNDSEVETVTVSHGGNGYTYGTLDLAEVGIPWFNKKHLMSSSLPMVDMGLTFTENLEIFRFCSMRDLRTILKTQISSQETSL